ncbi:protein C19orf12 homolog isoform X1 [Lytechinus variegatus]|uniref:protein C19orf12 homolog isoform X1 n=1 Tax=Lytechinus variegatus TaxID=7654 RepID=UPI001BB25CAD|nr:protein C19orf12 homolog isoform X1 [Lytechinus variegatus]
MPISAEELVRLLAILAEEENMKVTVKETLKGGAMAGAGAVIGGMCGGPMGLAVGGALGGAYARWRYKGKHEVVADVLRGLDEKQHEELNGQFKDILEDYPEDDFMKMTRRLNEDGELREKMRLKLKSFITDTLKRQLIEEYKQRGKAD